MNFLTRSQRPLMNLHKPHRAVCLAPRRTARAGRRAGTTMLEVALILPLLLLFTIGLVQYGVIVHTASNVKNIARETARFAAITRDSTNNYQTTRDFMRQKAIPLSLNPNDLQMSVTVYDKDNNSSRSVNGSGPQPIQPQSGYTIQVSVSYDMQKKMFIPANFAGVQFFNQTYESSVVMIIE